MKFIALIALVLGSFSAQAAEPTVPYIQFTRTNAGVAPKYRIRTTCTLDSSTVEEISFGTMVTPRPKSKAVSWTKAVPNAAGLEATLLEAAKGKIAMAKCHVVGGNVTTYSGVVKTVRSNKEKEVELGRLPCYRINTSDAAQDLIELLKKNCN